MLSLQAALWARRFCFCLSHLLDKACGRMPCESCQVTPGFRANIDLHAFGDSEHLCVCCKACGQVSKFWQP